MTLDWGDIYISIRTVLSKREASCRALAERCLEFTPHVRISDHGLGRTIPQSYTDALYVPPGRPHTWLLQLEDDAILAPDFERVVPGLLQSVPSNIGLVSFYSGRHVKPKDSLPYPSELETLPGARFVMAVALAFPVSRLKDHNDFVLDFMKRPCKGFNGEPTATDTATMFWLRARKYKYMRAWPSLVQHNLDLPSLCGHRSTANRWSPSFRAVYGNYDGK